MSFEWIDTLSSLDIHRLRDCVPKVEFPFKGSILYKPCSFAHLIAISQEEINDEILMNIHYEKAEFWHKVVTKGAVYMLGINREEMGMYIGKGYFLRSDKSKEFYMNRAIGKRIA